MVTGTWDWRVFPWSSTNAISWATGSFRLGQGVCPISHLVKGLSLKTLLRSPLCSSAGLARAQATMKPPSRSGMPPEFMLPLSHRDLLISQKGPPAGQANPKPRTRIEQGLIHLPLPAFAFLVILGRCGRVRKSGALYVCCKGVSLVCEHRLKRLPNFQMPRRCVVRPPQAEMMRSQSLRADAAACSKLQQARDRTVAKLYKVGVFPWPYLRAVASLFLV